MGFIWVDRLCLGAFQVKQLFFSSKSERKKESTRQQKPFFGAIRYFSLLSVRFLGQTGWLAGWLAGWQ
jgi:hypothetical protein